MFQTKSMGNKKQTENIKVKYLEHATLPGDQSLEVNSKKAVLQNSAKVSDKNM